MSESQTTETAAALTYEQVRDLAKAENLSNKKIRSLLYHAGCKDRFEELFTELGREKGDSGEANRAAKEAANEAADKIAAERAAKINEENAKKAAAEQAAREHQASLRLTDGAVVYCDAAQNKVERVVNSYGRKATFDNGGYRIGVKSGELERVFFNQQCPDSFAGECYAVLKTIELAAEHGCKSITLRNDRIGGYEATTKRGYIGTKYLYVAKKIATEAGLVVTFDQCAGSDNEADEVSRVNR